MASEDGEVFIKSLAQFIRTHEKALANALQIQQQRARHARSHSAIAARERLPSAGHGPSMHVLAAALSLGSLGLGLHSSKPAKLTLTPHHLFYLLSRFEELGVDVGAMNVRLENLNADSSPSNYVSFLSQPERASRRSDRDSIHSVSSVRSVMSNMSSFWSNLGWGFGASNEHSKTEKAQAQLLNDLKYVYSAFTKIPCLRLSPDHRARLIRGYEEFPFDSAVPLVAFKNVSVLEICDLDFRTFFGWDRLADQLRSLTIKRGRIDDPIDLLVHVVLDDMDKRRRRSSKAHSPSTPIWPPSPSPRHTELSRTISAPSSPIVPEHAVASSASPRNSAYLRSDVEILPARANRHTRDKSQSPSRGGGRRPGSSYRGVRAGGEKMKRTGSNSSNSSTRSLHSRSRSRSSSNLFSMGILPTYKWRFLRHLCLADNGLTSLTASSLAPLTNSLHSLDLSSNLFNEVPDCLAILTSLRALDLSNCMISSLHSLARNPLPAISVLNLRGNRLAAIAGVERMLSLERFDIRENRLIDPTEIARLTGIPDMREIWVQGNPFVRSHGNYRVTIFNLFRGTPGYRDDIVIDSSGPGYAERRQLRERVAEPSKPPMHRNQSVDFALNLPVEVKKAAAAAAAAATAAAAGADTANDAAERPLTPSPVYMSGHPALGARPRPQTTQSELAVSPSPRRRITKRRIVDLSAPSTSTARSPKTENLSPRTVTKDVHVSPVKPQTPELLSTPLATKPTNFDTSGDDPFVSSVVASNRVPPASSSVQSVGPLANGHADSSPPPAETIARNLQQLNLSGDAYRHKVQALKDEFGTGWLRVLDEQKKGSAHDGTSREAAFIPPMTLKNDMSSLRASSQGIVSGARTLG